jgi:DNA-directed RNA polymerase subunit RPC12/RpoP
MPREDDYDDYDDDYEEDLIDGVGFMDPGGNSALRAATPSNPRIYPCPTCEAPNRLTRIDVSHGYQCDRCADRQERGYD